MSILLEHLSEDAIQHYLEKSVSRSSSRRFSLPTSSDMVAMKSSNHGSSNGSRNGSGRRRRGSTGECAPLPLLLPVHIRPLQRRMRRFSMPCTPTSSSSSLHVYVDPTAEKPARLRRLRRCRSHDGIGISNSLNYDNSSANDRWDCEGLNLRVTKSRSVDELLSNVGSEQGNINPKIFTGLGYGDNQQAGCSGSRKGSAPPRMPRRESLDTTNHTGALNCASNCAASLPRHPSLPNFGTKAASSPTLPPRMPRRSSIGDFNGLQASTSSGVVRARGNATFPTRKSSFSAKKPERKRSNDSNYWDWFTTTPNHDENTSSCAKKEEDTFSQPSLVAALAARRRTASSPRTTGSTSCDCKEKGSSATTCDQHKVSCPKAA